jgi:hypothetical protein
LLSSPEPCAAAGAEALFSAGASSSSFTSYGLGSTEMPLAGALSAGGRTGRGAAARARLAFGLGGAALGAAATLAADAGAAGATLGAGEAGTLAALGARAVTAGCAAATLSSGAGDSELPRDNANVSSEAAAAEARDESSTMRLEDR